MAGGEHSIPISTVAVDNTLRAPVQSNKALRRVALHQPADDQRKVELQKESLLIKNTIKTWM
jgi:hypothetical protein